MNTDIIIPSQYLEDSDPKIYCKYVMSAVRPSSYSEIQKLESVIFVAGKDFGSGSSREQAPEAIKQSGVKAVIAESFASIFFRNSINVGLPVIELSEATTVFDELDEIDVNLETGVIKNLTTKKEYSGNPVEDFLLSKLKKGGLIPELRNYVRENSLG